jgi:hypothetical protein
MKDHSMVGSTAASKVGLTAASKAASMVDLTAVLKAASSAASKDPY